LFSSLKYLLTINQKTLHNFAAAILLSSRISAYKDAVPTNTLLVRVPIPFALHRGNLFQNILRKNRFDLPPGIENKPADYAKVVASVQDAFTQLRSKFKKAVCDFWCFIHVDLF
jgi:hypothetical protein